MADDGDSGIFKKGAESIKETGRALSDLADTSQRYSQTIVPIEANLGKFGTRALRTAEEVKTLNDRLKEGAKSLAKYADESFGAKAMLGQFQGIATGAIGKVKELTSVTNVYNRLVKELREGQNLQTKSMQANTAATDKASKGLTKTLGIIRGQYDLAGKMVKKYKVSQEEALAIQGAVRQTFHSNIMAYKDSGKAMEAMTEDVLVLSKVMGTDAPKMIEYMNSRMRASNLTMKEAQDETIRVAKAYDTYKIALDKLPAAFQKANVSQQDFMRTMGQANEAFKMGHFNAAKFAQVLVPLSLAGKQAGMSVHAVNAMNSAFVTLMKTMGGGQLKTVFGVRSAQDIRGRLEEYIAKSTGDTKKSLEFIKKELKGGMPEIHALQGIKQAMMGDPRMMADLMRRFQKVDKGVRTQWISDIPGMEDNMLGAMTLKNAFEPGSSVMKAWETTAEMSVEQVKAEQEAAAGRKKLEDLTAKGQSAVDKTFKRVSDVAELIDRLTLWLKANPWAALVALGAGVVTMGAKAVIQTLLLRRIALNTARMGKGIPGVGGGGPELPTSRTRPSTTGKWTTTAAEATTAATTAAAAKTGGWGPVPGRAPAPTPAAGGRFARMGGRLNSSGMLKGAVGIGAIVSVLDGIQTGLSTKGNAAAKLEAGAQRAGEGMLDTVTAGLYSAIGPKVTGLIIKHSSDEFKRKLGGDKSFARVVAESSTGEALFGGSRTKEQAKILKQMDEQRRNRRAALSHEEVAIYKQLLERKKIGEKLTDYQKKILEVNKRDYELRNKSVEIAKAEAKESQYKGVVAGMGEVDVEKLKKIKDGEKRARLFARTVIGGKHGGTLAGMVGGKEALEGLMSGKGGTAAQRLLVQKRMAEAGVTPEQVKRVAPSEFKAAYIRSVAEGRGTESMGVKKEEVAAYEAMKKERTKKGLTQDTWVASAAVAAGKRTGTGEGFRIKIEGDGKEAIAQEGKLNSTTSTIKYALPGSVLEIGIDNIVKGINQFTTNNPPPTNTSKV